MPTNKLVWNRMRTECGWFSIARCGRLWCLSDLKWKDAYGYPRAYYFGTLAACKRHAQCLKDASD